MANDLNRVVLVGRLTRDPELRSASTGNYFCRLTLASNRAYYKKEGDLKEEVGFFDCVAWGKLAEIISKYTQKGKRIAVDGSLRQNTWENSEGKKQSRVEVLIENFQFLDAKSSESKGSEPSSEPASNIKELEEENPFQSSNEEELDDIPF
ncbi:MAG: single-stranded DNA-binding protein [Spirochaetia bacterium]|nr:single-stranded DNA-binding protein [Spirochaetia bacterium]